MKSIKVWSFVAGVSYFTWWWSFLFFLPLDKLKEDYSILISSNCWIPINLLQVIGAIAFTMFFVEFSNHFYSDNTKAAVFKLLQVIGLFCFCGVAFYESFLWPIVAKRAPEILNVVDGPIYTSNLFIIPTGVAILAFMTGNIYLGIQFVKTNKLVSLIYIGGITLFCLGYLSGSARYIVQSIGITLLTTGFLGIGFKVKQFK